MDLSKLIAESIKIGTEIQNRPVKVKSTTNEVPRPSTWEYLIDALTLVPQGTFIPLKQIVEIMHARGWSTKAGTPELQYRTVHSSTYKACRDDRNGYILNASCIDRSKARDTLYALKIGSTFTKYIKQHNQWVESFIPTPETDGKDTEQVLTPEQDGKDTEHSPEEVTEQIESKVSTRKGTTRNRKTA